MLATILARSVINRRGKLFLSSLGIMVSALLIASFLMVARGMESRFQREHSRYGGNLLVLPAQATPDQADQLLGIHLDVTDVSLIEKDRREDESLVIVPFLYFVVKVNGHAVAAAGTRLDRLSALNPSWNIVKPPQELNGGLPSLLIGADVAQKIGVAIGTAVELSYRGASEKFMVTGIVDTGQSEDSQVMMDIQKAWQLTGLRGKANLMVARASGGPGAVEKEAERIASYIPGVQVRPVMNLIAAERRFLGKLSLFFGSVALIVVVTSAMGLGAAMGASVLERSREIGLMKALGASNRVISLIFFIEASLAGAAGGAIGAALGALFAMEVARRTFGSSISFDPVSFSAGIGFVIVVSWVASFIPIRRAVEIPPAIVLRRE